MLSLKELEKLREERGLEIFNSNRSHIKSVNAFSFSVLSQSGNGKYSVSKVDGEWVCECPDHKFRGLKCKHAWAVEISIKLREEVQKDNVIQEITISKCVYCQSQNIKKNGVRHNKSGDIQRFICEKCSKTFSINIGFEKMKHNPQAIYNGR